MSAHPSCHVKHATWHASLRYRKKVMTIFHLTPQQNQYPTVPVGYLQMKQCLYSSFIMNTVHNDQWYSVCFFMNYVSGKLAGTDLGILIISQP